ncbi:ATP-binding protein, partial [Paracoccus sp. FO-3]|uniref:AAA family ATPase n=1 Tax=Paracoccus sp. FO-3 TaxID=1335059 RepID=UPI001127FAF2
LAIGAQAPWLEDIHGDSPALRAARQIVRDLRGWKTGEVAWPDLTRTLLLYGPPGTGKSWIARAMGNSAGFSVVTGTFGEWQAAGHLGDMLREMRRTFRDARTKAPSVGTCNHPDLIDPAVLRAGRFDMKVSLPLPDAEGLFSVFRHCLPDWREADLRDLAARAVGCSAADVDAV